MGPRETTKKLREFSQGKVGRKRGHPNLSTSAYATAFCAPSWPTLRLLKGSGLGGVTNLFTQASPSLRLLCRILQNGNREWDVNQRRHSERQHGQSECYTLFPEPPRQLPSILPGHPVREHCPKGGVVGSSLNPGRTAKANDIWQVLLPRRERLTCANVIVRSRLNARGSELPTPSVQLRALSGSTSITSYLILLVGPGGTYKSSIGSRGRDGVKPAGPT